MKTLESLRRDKYRGHAATTTGYFDHVFAVKQPKTAAQLESLVEEYITLLNGICTNIYGGGRQLVSKTNVTDVLGNKNSITDVKFIPSRVRVGHSDMIASVKGKAYYLEIKLGKDRQSKYQKEFEKYVNDRGAVYVIVKKLEDIYFLSE